MTTKERIDYMIDTLQVVKDEIAYAEWYSQEQAKDSEEFTWYGHAGYGKRQPSGTIIRESLKMVGRIAKIASDDVCLSPYNGRVFKK